MKNLNKRTIIFSILYIVIGALELIFGSDASTKLFLLDNIMVRLGGAVLLVSAAGILLDKELARKGMLAALILHLAELVIGAPANATSAEIFLTVAMLIVVYIPMLYLAFPESMVWGSIFGVFRRKKTIAAVDPVEFRIRNEIEQERKIKNGASWLYWIAGLSVVNSGIFYFDGGLNFIFGLGATQYFDALAYSFYDYFGMPVLLLGYALDAFLVGLFIYLGIMASKCRKWAFIAGMILYALDTLVFIVFTDFIGIAAHVFALAMIFNTYKALNAVQVSSEEVEQDI